MSYKDKPLAQPVEPTPPPSCSVCHEEAHIIYMKSGSPSVLLALSGACSCMGEWQGNIPTGLYGLMFPDWDDNVHISQVTKYAPHPPAMQRCLSCGSPRLNLHRWNDKFNTWETPTGVCGCVEKVSYADISSLWKECKSLHQMIYAKEAIRKQAIDNVTESDTIVTNMDTADV